MVAAGRVVAIRGDGVSKGGMITWFPAALCAYYLDAFWNGFWSWDVYWRRWMIDASFLSRAQFHGK